MYRRSVFRFVRCAVCITIGAVVGALCGLPAGYVAYVDHGADGIQWASSPAAAGILTFLEVLAIGVAFGALAAGWVEALLYSAARARGCRPASTAV